MSRAAVITVSDRSAAGEREDASGPVAVAALRDAGWECDDAAVVPDDADAIARAIEDAVSAGAALVVTTGGTGVGPRDVTPEATAPLLERELPGIAEELRRRSAQEKPTGMLSRGLAGTVGRTLVVNLPGSPGGVASGMPVVLSVAKHVAHQLAGEDHG